MANAHEIIQRMREIQAAREAAFEPLAEILGQRQELQRQLALLDEPYGKAYVDAEAAGWTSEELTAIGCEEPEKRPKGRPRRRAAAKRTGSEAPSSGPSTAPSAATLPAQEGAGADEASSAAAASG
ncbi:hypothetical protein [Streptomyces triculaminicus]|uniref:hypothetical protein n=1 Tax=Streptomyces triculaminicus TaxID=2816232 RepID=UPI0037D98BBB